MMPEKRETQNLAPGRGPRRERGVRARRCSCCQQPAHVEHEGHAIGPNLGQPHAELAELVPERGDVLRVALHGVVRNEGVKHEAAGREGGHHPEVDHLCGHADGFEREAAHQDAAKSGGEAHDGERLQGTNAGRR